MNNFVLTKEILLSARTYVPLSEKEEFVGKYAERCFDRLSITAGDDAMPPMYQENVSLKGRYLMYALAALYLKQEAQADDGLLSVEDYDRYAGGHLVMQIERLKKDAECRDKCYDLLSDYFDLVKRFETQIRGLLAVQNDIVVRQQLAAKDAMAELPKVLEAIKELQGRGVEAVTDGA